MSSTKRWNGTYHSKYAMVNVGESALFCTMVEQAHSLEQVSSENEVCLALPFARRSLLRLIDHQLRGHLP